MTSEHYYCRTVSPEPTLKHGASDKLRKCKNIRKRNPQNEEQDRKRQGTKQRPNNLCLALQKVLGRKPRSEFAPPQGR